VLCRSITDYNPTLVLLLNTTITPATNPATLSTKNVAFSKFLIWKLYFLLPCIQTAQNLNPSYDKHSKLQITMHNLLKAVLIMWGEFKLTDLHTILEGLINTMKISTTTAGVLFKIRTKYILNTDEVNFICMDCQYNVVLLNLSSRRSLLCWHLLNFDFTRCSPVKHLFALSYTAKIKIFSVHDVWCW
jgi:hypothetical protein